MEQQLESGKTHLDLVVQSTKGVEQELQQVLKNCYRPPLKRIVFMQVTRHTRPEGHFNVWATITGLEFHLGEGKAFLILKRALPLENL